MEIVHYEPQFPVPRHKAEQRARAHDRALFLLAGLAGAAFVVAYIWWPWQYETGAAARQAATPRCSA